MHCDDRRPPWLQWVIELQSIAQCGLTYAKDVYDIERYQRLRELSAQMLAAVSELPVELPDPQTGHARRHHSGGVHPAGAGAKRAVGPARRLGGRA